MGAGRINKGKTPKSQIVECSLTPRLWRVASSNHSHESAREYYVLLPTEHSFPLQKQLQEHTISRMYFISRVDLLYVV